MSETLDGLGEKIVGALAGSATGHSVAFDQLTVTVQAERIVEVVKYLRDEASLRFVGRSKRAIQRPGQQCKPAAKRQAAKKAYQKDSPFMRRNGSLRKQRV